LRNWFRTQTAGGAQPFGVAPPEAVVVTDQRAVDAAYEQGRLQERERLARTRRGGSPVVALLVVLAVVFAVGMVYLAIRNGSFAGAGAAVDNGLAKAGDSVAAPIHNAKEKTGAALEKAGRDLK
jgi:flagellin-like protein